jgi:Skp family chaperone for outer membrane proteins
MTLIQLNGANKKTVFLISLFLGLSAYASFAQVAVVDSRKLIAAVPQIAKADTLVAQKQQELSADFQARSEYVERQAVQADSLLRLRPKDSLSIQKATQARTLIEDLRKLQQSYNKQLEDYRSLLLTPYYDRINAAIKAVAIRRKQTQVIDLQFNSLLWFDPATDITEQVIVELKAK